MTEKERGKMEYIKIGELQVSRFIIGGNPFSAFSHQGVEMDEKMKRYYTCQKIKDTLAEAERLGINTFVGRADNHIIRLLLEYWDEGGKIQWFAQTAPEVGSSEINVKMAKEGGAMACHIHGGVMDYLLAQGRLGEAKETVKMIRDAGMAVAVAGHKPKVFHWAKENIDVDYYLCSYYDATPRDEKAELVPGQDENYREEDRGAMMAVIPQLSKPVIHYKIMAAGRNEPAEAFAYTAKHLRTGDAVCVGVYTKDLPGMLEEDVKLFEKSLAEKYPQL